MQNFRTKFCRLMTGSTCTTIINVNTRYLIEFLAKKYSDIVSFRLEGLTKLTTSRLVFRSLRNQGVMTLSVYSYLS